MNDRWTADGDRVLPTEIEHRCEEMFDGDRLTQKYNYVVYHFENGGHYYWARAYLEDIDTVALFGPLDNRTTRRTVAGQMDADVLAYLQRRFQEIQALGDEGYRVIWSRDR
jgi:hypothetical protein